MFGLQPTKDFMNNSVLPVPHEISLYIQAVCALVFVLELSQAWPGYMQRAIAFCTNEGNSKTSETRCANRFATPENTPWWAVWFPSFGCSRSTLSVVCLELKFLLSATLMLHQLLPSPLPKILGCQIKFQKVSLVQHDIFNRHCLLTYMPQLTSWVGSSSALLRRHSPTKPKRLCNCL